MKLIASICYICPLCIIARVLPDSKFAKGMEGFGKICPFCKAYTKLKSNQGVFKNDSRLDSNTAGRNRHS